MPIMDLLPLSLTTSAADLKLYNKHRSSSSAGSAATPPGGSGAGASATVSNPNSNGSNSSSGSGAGGTDKRIERRKPNWTECENVLLLDQFSLHAELLTCKATDASTNLRKQEVWRIICQNLNRQNTLVRRTPAEVRRKWKNLVTAAKKEVWEIRHQVHLTGGAAVRRISELSQRVLQLHSSGGESSSSSAAAAAAAAASLFLASNSHHLNNHNNSEDFYEAKLKLDALSNGLSGYYRSGTSTPVHHPIVQLNEQSTPSIGDDDDYCYDDADEDDDCDVDNNNNGNGSRVGTGISGVDRDRDRDRRRHDEDDDDVDDDDDGARSMMSCSPSDSLLRHAPGSNEFDSGIYEEDAPHDLRVNKSHGMVMLNGHGPHLGLAQMNGVGLNGKNPYIQKSITTLQSQLNMSMSRKSNASMNAGGTAAVNSSGGTAVPSSTSAPSVDGDLIRTRLELQIDVLRLRKRRMEIELRRLARFQSISLTRAGAGGESSWWRKRYRNYLNNVSSNSNKNRSTEIVKDNPTK